MLILHDCVKSVLEGMFFVRLHCGSVVAAVHIGEDGQEVPWADETKSQLLKDN